jgi:hypothetical protein
MGLNLLHFQHAIVDGALGKATLRLVALHSRRGVLQHAHLNRKHHKAVQTIFYHEQHCLPGCVHDTCLGIWLCIPSNTPCPACFLYYDHKQARARVTHG